MRPARPRHVIAAALGVEIGIRGGVGMDQPGDWLPRRSRDEGPGVPTRVLDVVRARL